MVLGLDKGMTLVETRTLGIMDQRWGALLPFLCVTGTRGEQDLDRGIGDKQAENDRIEGIPDRKDMKPMIQMM